MTISAASTPTMWPASTASWTTWLKPCDPRTMRRPSYRLHQLRGNRRSTWSVRLSGNWRVTFRFVEGRAVDIDLEDYH